MSRTTVLGDFDRAVGAWLKHYRQSLDLTQAEVAEGMNDTGLLAQPWSQPIVSYLEAGRRVMLMTDFFALAAWVGVTPSAMYRRILQHLTEAA